MGEIVKIQKIQFFLKYLLNWGGVNNDLKLWQNMRFQKCQLFAKLPQGITSKCLKFFPTSTGFFRVAQNWTKYIGNVDFAGFFFCLRSDLTNIFALIV